MFSDTYGDDKQFTLQAYVDEQIQNDPPLKEAPVEQKLNWLMDYESQLLQKYKEKKLMEKGPDGEELPDNREGIQNFCRMTGSISQSYFLLD